jgi:GH3 auxin-responsive promoter
MSVARLLSLLAGQSLVRLGVNRAFHHYARRRTSALAAADPVTVQAATLRDLLRRARNTRFGKDHGFATIGRVDDFRKAVPLRNYDDLWREYLRPHYPVCDDLTWPGRIPYFALTSGTTQGATKYIPVSRAMLASNEKAARTLVAYHMASRPDSRLFSGRMFFLGGSSDLETPAPGVEQGDLSGIAAKELRAVLRPYAFPPLELALEPDWDRKLALLAETSRVEPVTLVGGVPSWMLALFQRLLAATGRSTIAEVWPALELVVHGGVKFDPYRSSFVELLGKPAIRLQESYPCSEGFIAFGDPASGLLRLCFDHGIFYEFVPLDELGSDRPTRHWLGDAQTGVNYAIVVSTCAGMWAHVIGDTVRFESLAPPLLTFTGRTKYSLSAFGEHLISEEVEGAVATASEASGAAVRDWHVGPVFHGALGHHLFVVEFLDTLADLQAFRGALDADLSRRNADYRAHRAGGVGLPLPAVVVASPGGLDEWMRSRGKLGGQHKLPRMDGTGALTRELVEFLRGSGRVALELPAGP